MTEAGFSEKLIFAVKSTERARNGFDFTFHKIVVLLFAGSNL